MKMIKYFLIAVLTFMVFILYIGMINLISSPRTNFVIPADVIIPVLFIAIQISILSVHKFKQLENELRKNN